MSQDKWSPAFDRDNTPPPRDEPRGGKGLAILGVIGLIVIGVMLMNKDRFSTPETWVKYVQYMPTFDECYRNAQGFGATHATAYKICREGIGFALRQ